jgi:hypothetical protein
MLEQRHEHPKRLFLQADDAALFEQPARMCLNFEETEAISDGIERHRGGAHHSASEASARSA